METSKRRMPRAALTALAALVTGTAVVAVALGAVTAAAAAEPSIVDPSARGEIVIHEFREPAGQGEGGAAGATGDGTLQNTDGLTPLAGVGFRLAQLDPQRYDLATTSGWDALSTLSAAQAAKVGTAYTVEVSTDAAGIADAAGLPLGAYLVTETSWPAGATPAAPFLVTVPMTDPASSSSWMYTVHVYPKSAIAPLPSSDPSGATVSTGGAGMGAGGWGSVGSGIRLAELGGAFAVLAALLALLARRRRGGPRAPGTGPAS